MPDTNHTTPLSPLPTPPASAPTPASTDALARALAAFRTVHILATPDIAKVIAPYLAGFRHFAAKDLLEGKLGCEIVTGGQAGMRRLNNALRELGYRKGRQQVGHYRGTHWRYTGEVPTPAVVREKTPRAPSSVVLTALARVEAKLDRLLALVPDA